MVRNIICCASRCWQAEAHGACLSSFCLTIFFLHSRSYLHDNATTLRFCVSLRSLSLLVPLLVLMKVKFSWAEPEV